MRMLLTLEVKCGFQPSSERFHPLWHHTLRLALRYVRRTVQARSVARRSVCALDAVARNLAENEQRLWIAQMPVDLQRHC